MNDSELPDAAIRAGAAVVLENVWGERYRVGEDRVRAVLVAATERIECPECVAWAAVTNECPVCAGSGRLYVLKEAE